jgi:hypothetical protein
MEKSRPPDREDQLSPARERRRLLEESRSERPGDGTPIGGPIESPPVDPETT